MSGNPSKIEWTERTWNPVRGCSMAPGSELGGCLNCYAARMAARGLPGMNSPTTGAPFAILRDSGPRWTGKVELIEAMLDIPLRRRIPTTYFVNSMSDLFHESLPDEAIDRIFAVMALCPQHTFQILTKRPERMREFFANDIFSRVVCCCNRTVGGDDPTPEAPSLVTLARRLRREPQQIRLPLPNVWLGVSVENQGTADARIPMLLQTPAALRFISAEPLLGPVDLANFCWREHPDGMCDHEDSELDWVICGGESGPGARPMHPDWARGLRDQCEAAGVPLFFKQWGEWLPGDQDGARLDGEQVLNCTDEPIRVGKRKAGALLDGRERKQVPNGTGA